MPQNYKTISVVCPLFHGDDGASMVKCEGILGNNGKCESIQTFHHKDDFLIQVREFCCKKYNCCPYYIGVKIANYDDDEEISWDVRNRRMG